MPEVLIVGAGASGAVAAKRLAEEGFDVVCLEQGDWADYTRARAPYPDYELTSGAQNTWTLTMKPNIELALEQKTVDQACADADKGLDALIAQK